MSVTVTPYIYLNDGDSPHALLLEVLDTHTFANTKDAQDAMAGLRSEIGASVYGGMLTVEFDVE